MAIAPTFEDSQGTDFIGQQMSLMQRAQAMRHADQRAAQERAQFEAFKPVIAAEAQAKLLGARAAIDNAARMERLRAQAAAESTIANDEFLEAMKYANYSTKASALAELQAKYAWMGLLPEYKAFSDTIADERVKAHQSAVLDMNLEGQLERAQEMNASRQLIADENNQLRRELQTMRDTEAGKRAQAANQTRLEVADKRNEAPAERIRFLTEEAQQAEAEGNRDLATALRARIQKETASTGRSSRRELPPAVADALGIQPAQQEQIQPASKEPVQNAVQKPVKGTRAKQNGVWYQFDGSTWNKEADK